MVTAPSMLVSWWLSIGWACEPVVLEEVSVAPGTVTVLGERHGRREDLGRARFLVEEAAEEHGLVTVALEAVGAEHQGVLDRLSAGEIRPGRVRRLVDWSESWGYPFRPYKQVLRIPGVRFVAAGPELGPKPEDVEIPVPDAYEKRLAEVARAHHHGGDDPDAVRRFAEAMAWRDHQIAKLSVDGWDPSTPLVVLTGRGHVQGGLGVTWQLDAGLSEADHQRVLLAPSARCEAGDLVLGTQPAG